VWHEWEIEENTEFWSEDMKGKHHLGDLGVDGRIVGLSIKMDIKEIGRKDVDWIYLAQYRDRWRALVNTVMNSGFMKIVRTY
jgi:hypothetical protein